MKHLGLTSNKNLGLKSNKNLEIVKDLNEDEYVYLHNHNSNVQELLQEVKFIDDVLYAFSEYKQETHDIAEKKFSASKLGKDINRLVSNYLTSVKAFLDHWETYIKRKFGQNSLMLNCFKEITSNVYDKNFSYRFIYSLRNFVQHCGKCITTTKCYLDEYGNVHLDILAKRDYLLENFTWKGIIKKDLINMPDFINIDFHLKGMEECILKIQSTLINEHMNSSIIESCIELLSIKQLYNNANCDYSILDFKNEELILLSKHVGNQIPMNIEQIPMQYIENILAQFYKNNFKNEVKIFSMKGHLVGKNLFGFPIREKENLIQFNSGGCETFFLDGDKWTKITETISFCNIDSTDKLFSIYTKGNFTFTELRKMQAMSDSIRDNWNIKNMSRGASGKM